MVTNFLRKHSSVCKGNARVQILMVYILHNQTCNCATVMLLTDFVGNRIGKLIVSGRLSCCYYQPLQQKSKLLYVQMKYYKKYAYILPCSCTLQNNKWHNNKTNVIQSNNCYCQFIWKNVSIKITVEETSMYKRVGILIVNFQHDP